MNHNFKVNYEKCVKCGLCIENCPTRALEYDDYKSPKMERAKNCMKCQHCLAICPVGAISIMDKANVEIIAGVNLPMLIKLAALRKDCGLKDVVIGAQDAGKKYINIASQLLG